VAKASRYHVWIETNGQKVWEAETKTTELVYPGDPPLQPGINYCLEVATDIQTFSSPKGPEPHLQFQILPPDQAQPIQSNLESLANQRLSAEALGLAQVFCYRSFELRAEAIETLEALITASCKIPAVYRSLANLYQETRLLTLAKEPYLTGVALAQAQEDLETEALISAELGWIYYQTGHGEEAKSWWNRAQEKFLQLGAPMGEQEVAAWLSRL
jgi:tetratricopeptide (TPR) repeat protein